MKIGDTIEAAYWLSGDETADDLALLADDARLSIDRCAEGFVVGPLRAITKYPGDDRVPEVPDNVHGPDVRLLVVEADALTRLPVLRANSFIGELDPVDLTRLREITRQAHLAKNKGASPLTDAECDDVIEAIGPESAAQTVRAAVDSHMVH